MSWVMVGSLFLVYAIMMTEVFVQHFGESDTQLFRTSSFISSIYVVLLIITFIL
jgi:hypothetical protein